MSHYPMCSYARFFPPASFSFFKLADVAFDSFQLRCMTGPFGGLLIGSTEVLIHIKLWVVGRLGKATSYRLLTRDFSSLLTIVKKWGNWCPKQ